MTTAHTTRENSMHPKGRMERALDAYLDIWDVLIRPFLFWPYPLRAIRNDPRHEWDVFHPHEKIAFVVLCLLGALAQAILLWGLVLQPFLGVGAPIRMLWLILCAIAFVTLSAFRVLVHIVYED